MIKRAIAILLALFLIHADGVMVAVLAEPASGHASLEGIEVAADQVKLRFSEPVKHTRFITNKPPRVVLELLNTQINVADKILDGQGKYLKRVRCGQFMGEPNPVARVVLDLTRPVKDQIEGEGNELVVRLGKVAAKAPSEAASELAAAAGEKSDMQDAPDSAASEAPKTAKAPAADDGAMPKEGSSTTANELDKMASDESAVQSQDAAADKTAAAAPAARKARKTTSFRATGMRRDLLANLPKDTVSLDLDNTDIGDILKLLGAKSGINLIYGTDVAGSLTLHLNDVPFNEAFNIVLNMKGLIAEQVGENIVRVMTPAEAQRSRTNAVGTTRVYTLNYSKASEVKPTIDQVRTAEKRVGATVIDDKTNSLIVTDTPEGLASVERLLNQLDIRPKQVLIEAKLVEVNLSKDVELGIQWDYYSHDTGKFLGKTGENFNGSPVYPQPLPSQTFVDLSNLARNNLLQTTINPTSGASGRGTGVLLPADKIFGALTLGRITNNYILSATLTAAASQGKVKVLSDPKIATLNGKLATINITTSFPYVTSTVASTGVATQSVQYTVTGIQLSVTPLINTDGRITLKVMPNVSKPSAQASAAGVTGAIAVDTRQAETNVLVRDGETIVIGGLITDSVSNSEAKVPLLGDIPVLGWLFKKKTTTRSRVELLIFVTTRIMPD